MTIASIDIGSNTVLLLIVEYLPIDGSIKSILNRQEIPRISEGLQPGKPINSKKILELINILSDYRNIIDHHDCRKVILRGTNAFRIASNAYSIVKKIKEIFGWDLEIISGEEEARLTYLGSAFPFDGKKAKVVIDIGGGSTEIIKGIQQEILFKYSFQIGVVSIKERFFSASPPTDDIISEAYEFAAKTFSALNYNEEDATEFVAVAGTPTTLACIKNKIKVYDELIVDSTILCENDLIAFTSEFRAHSASEIEGKYGEVTFGRADLMLGGTLILHQIMKQLKAKEVRVNSRGLRYGAIYDSLREIQLKNGGI